MKQQRAKKKESEKNMTESEHKALIDKERQKAREFFPKLKWKK